MIVCSNDVGFDKIGCIRFKLNLKKFFLPQKYLSVSVIRLYFCEKFPDTLKEPQFFEVIWAC